ncbi:MAG: hypothetical protein HRT35_37785 [Algicola sp.]|nr:hypothetical protein [Algicola sp.]
MKSKILQPASATNSVATDANVVSADAIAEGGQSALGIGGNSTDAVVAADQAMTSMPTNEGGVVYSDDIVAAADLAMYSIPAGEGIASHVENLGTATKQL